LNQENRTTLVNTPLVRPTFYMLFYTLLEEMVLFRTRNGSIPRFIYETPKWFYRTIFFKKVLLDKYGTPGFYI